jgi:glycosyltransferase involved in cell wall biosynthesis
MSEAPLRVAIDARVLAGEMGGVESVLIGLAKGLSELDGDSEEYLFLAYEDRADWLRPYLGGMARIFPMKAALGSLARPWRRRLKTLSPRLAGMWGRRPAVLGPRPRPPVSDGTLEAAGVDVIHFLVQTGFLTKVPSIYHPHDLQHIHLPQYFTPSHFRWREANYRALCEQAAMVAVASTWTKHDVERQYGLPADRVVVVPLAPPTGAVRKLSSKEVDSVARRLNLPSQYIFYPAQTWPHKNHIRLLEALRQLRDRGLVIPLVSTGQQNEHFQTIERKARELGLTEQIRWLGYRPSDEMPAIYQRATCVVIPSEFEAASGPLWEAFLAGVPAACSNVTSLPEQAGDAAIIFDPRSHTEIAEAIQRLWLDEPLRNALVERGRQRVGHFTWDRTARIFRAHYRRIGGRQLSTDDVELMSSDVPI